MVYLGRLFAGVAFTCFYASTATAESYVFPSASTPIISDIAFGLTQDTGHGQIYLQQQMVQPHSQSAKRLFPLDPKHSAAAGLRQLIGWAEAGAKGYDAVQYGARRRPAKPPTDMTISEIYQWIASTPGQQHAIGRYQFIPATLKRLVTELRLPVDTQFSRSVQDSLADLLLIDAGINKFANGAISRHRFMENLARIWAGFPTASGRSHYHGIAGNRAVLSWNEFDKHMSQIFPQG